VCIIQVVTYYSFISKGKHKSLRAEWVRQDGLSNSDLPYPKSVAAWALITGRTIVDDGNTDNKDMADRDVRRLKQRGIWDDIRKQIVAASPGKSVSNDSCSVYSMYHRYADPHEPIRAIKNLYRQIVAIPVPMVDEGDATSSLSPLGVFCAEMKTELSITQAELDRAALVADLADLSLRDK
jgi:hypothetical protein